MTKVHTDPAPPRHPRLRIARRAAIGLAALGAGYLALVIHPQSLFAYSLQRGNIVLHARVEFPPQVAPMLEDAAARVSRSPLYDGARTHEVFLCDTSALFNFFALWDFRSGGVTHTWYTGNAFIRPTNLRQGRVIGRSGIETGGERTLAYFIAHEVTHAMTMDRIGRWRLARLARFQEEGYADYVAVARAVDLERGRADLLAGTADMDPRRSGRYDRYRLLVGYLLQRRGLSVDELLARPIDKSEVEGALLADVPP